MSRLTSRHVTLVYETKEFSLASTTLSCSVHQHGRCAFVFLILRECLQTTYSVQLNGYTIRFCPQIQKLEKHHRSQSLTEEVPESIINRGSVNLNSSFGILTEHKGSFISLPYRSLFQ